MKTKKEKQEESQIRDEKWAAMTWEQRLEEVKKRPGNSTKEVELLTAKIWLKNTLVGDKAADKKLVKASTLKADQAVEAFRGSHAVVLGFAEKFMKSATSL